MFQRKIIYILTFLLILFVWNIALYQGSDDYKFILKKLKYNEDVTAIPAGTVNDNYSLNDTSSWTLQNSTTRKTQTNSGGSVKTVENKELKGFTGASLIKKSTSTEEELMVSAGWEKILQMFENGHYTKVENHGSLFDMTTEYPDGYLEYQYQDLTIYFFPTKTYDQIIDIFFAISKGLPFQLNKNSDFGEKSFFINIAKDFQDEYVRIVILYKKEVFWLKIKKTKYNEVKNILKTLRTTN